jgi:hypothetical protein
MVLNICRSLAKKFQPKWYLSEESSYIWADVKNHIRLHQISYLNYVGPLLDNAPKGIWHKFNRMKIRKESGKPMKLNELPKWAKEYKLRL